MHCQALLGNVLRIHLNGFNLLPKNLFIHLRRSYTSYHSGTKSRRLSQPYLLKPYHCASRLQNLQRWIYSTAMADTSHYILPNEQPVVVLDCEVAFNALTKQEKRYAHHLSRASWYGGLIILVQTSPESPLIFSLLHKMFSEQSVSELKKVALEDAKVTEDDYQALLVYTSGIFTNMGNYKGIGDSKFVPNLGEDKLEAIIKSSNAYKKNPESTISLWQGCKNGMYSLEKKELSLGLGEKGVSTYFSANCTPKDADYITEFFKKKNIDAYNSRTFKVKKESEDLYEVRLASVETGNLEGLTTAYEKFENGKVRITRGDYSSLLALVVQEIRLAQEFAANDNERKMLEFYDKSFTTGSLVAHKDGSRYWIKDKGPVIETYIGFIETYRDPAGMRGEFEGFVAMVNKEMSAKFAELVDKAVVFLPQLPWPAEFEKDAFLRPDFTSLDVLTFAGSGIPAGINIPNYDEIRQSEGFKNVSLGNVFPASYQLSVVPFLSKEDHALFTKYRVQSFEVQLGLHELLGHGSGKLLRKEESGEFNFDVDAVKDPLTGNKVASWFDVGESYDSKFSSLGSTYEECRAECVGLYLSMNKDVLKIFGHEGEDAEDVMYINWLCMMWNGVCKSLEMYQPETKKWLQAHSQARYVIMRVILEAGEGLLEIKETEPGANLLMTMDRSKIQTVGKKAIGDFLLKLQVYKSTCNVKAAKEMYEKYSEVSDEDPYPWAKWRDIVMAHKQPRKMFVQANTNLEGEAVSLQKYEPTHEGLINSWVDRFPSNEVYTLLEELSKRDLEHFSCNAGAN